MALSGSSGQWSYGQLRDAVVRRAQDLRRTRKSLAFCLCRNNADTVIDYLSARHAGHAVALFDARIHTSLLERLMELYSPEFILDSGRLETRSSSPADIGQSLAVLLSTSGTTGSPKLVRLSAENVQANATAIASALDISSEDRPIASLPLHYSYGLSVLNSHLAAGACFVLTEESMMQNTFWETVRQHECTSFAGVPYLYQMLDRLDLDRLRVPSLQVFTQAGGKLIPALMETFHHRIAARQGRFFVMYGQRKPRRAFPCCLGKICRISWARLDWPFPVERCPLRTVRSPTAGQT
jgi:acyl-CoA synthetase (AMP-forming)/AMP-acid ligase II